MTEAREDHLIWDMVLPLAASVGNDFELVERFRQAGHTYVSLTIAGDDCGLAETMHRLSQARRAIQERSDRFALVENVSDITRAKASGRLAIGLHLEGTECLERDPDVLDALYALGIRHAILAFNQNNSAAGGCADLGNAGLTRAGRRLIDRMGEIGMLLDLSHMSERSTLEAIEHSGRPAVFSHSNCKALHDHFRNLSDEQIRACAAADGIVGISGSTLYLGEWPSFVEGVYAHLDHVVQLVGPAHAGLGTDYVHDADAVLRIFAERPDEWPASNGGLPASIGYMPPEDIHPLIDRLERAGYDNNAVTGILGGNYMRIAGNVWR